MQSEVVVAAVGQLNVVSSPLPYTPGEGVRLLTKAKPQIGVFALQKNMTFYMYTIPGISHHRVKPCVCMSGELLMTSKQIQMMLLVLGLIT